MEKSWERLWKKVEKYDIALFLGAGVSKRSEFPDWAQLVSELSGHSVEFVRRLECEQGIALATQIGVIRDRTREKDWIPLLRRLLHRNFFSLIAKSQPTISGLTTADFRIKKFAHEDAVASVDARARVARFFQLTNPILSEIVQMCAKPNSSADGWRANKRVGAVLTTNIDALVQLCDRAFHRTPRVFRTVERATKSGEVGKTPLYHLHGYLHPLPAKSDEEAPDRIIVTAGEYLIRNDDPYSWPNTILHWALREFPVVFIGCSLTDELVRRALHRSTHERIEESENERPGKKVREKHRRRNFAITRRREDHRVNDILDSSLAKIGVWPLWIEDYENDLVTRLGQLRAKLHS